MKRKPNRKRNGRILTPRNIAVREEHAEWVKLRREGARVIDIAAKYGKSKGTVSEVITAMVREVGSEDALVVREMELARLDFGVEKLWPVLEAGGDGVHAAIASLTRLSKRRSELTGCDAPARAPVDEDGNTVGGEVDAVAILAGRIARLAAKRGPGEGAGGPDAA